MHCGSRSITTRRRGENGLQRYDCPSCALEQGQQFVTFNHWTGSVFEQIETNQVVTGNGMVVLPQLFKDRAFLSISSPYAATPKI